MDLPVSTCKKLQQEEIINKNRSEFHEIARKLRREPTNSLVVSNYISQAFGNSVGMLVNSSRQLVFVDAPSMGICIFPKPAQCLCSQPIIPEDLYKNPSAITLYLALL